MCHADACWFNWFEEEEKFTIPDCYKYRWSLFWRAYRWCLLNLSLWQIVIETGLCLIYFQNSLIAISIKWWLVIELSYMTPTCHVGNINLWKGFIGAKVVCVDIFLLKKRWKSWMLFSKLNESKREMKITSFKAKEVSSFSSTSILYHCLCYMYIEPFGLSWYQ